MATWTTAMSRCHMREKHCYPWWNALWEENNVLHYAFLPSLHFYNFYLKQKLLLTGWVCWGSKKWKMETCEKFKKSAFNNLKTSKSQFWEKYVTSCIKGFVIGCQNHLLKCKRWIAAAEKITFPSSLYADYLLPSVELIAQNK